MIEGITAGVEVALLAAFVLVLGAFAVLLWDRLREAGNALPDTFCFTHSLARG
jgi:hypothetical protein